VIARMIIGNLRQRPWQFALAVLLCGLGLAVAVAIVWLQSLLTEHAKRQAQGIDIVVGAKGSALQNVLAAVYQIDVPNGNITLRDVDALRRNPMVAKAIPIAMGDSVAGARIVGSTPDLLPFYGAELASGEWPQAPMDAAIGAAVGKRTGLKPGDYFSGVHGMGAGGEAHDGAPYRVTAVLKPSGRVIDQLVVTPIESVWAVHEGHLAGTEPEATFALIQTTGPVAMATLPRMINSQTGMQAAVPALESARLLATFDWVALLVKAFATILLLAALASLLGALLQALARREADLALLRALGARRRTLAALIGGEALLLAVAASVLAGALTVAGVASLQAFALPGLAIDWPAGFLCWLGGLMLALLLAVVASIPVLWRAHAIDMASQLSSR